ncbi:MAG: Rrf2 family transcriptional regulator [Coriobacteriia bacterium]|nr:Rrf2 family transcriptional regulator [Coriobacteriia bacterium]
MEITRRSDYAIRIMLELARQADSAPVSVRRLAERQELPYAFARSIQRDLVAAGLVTTQRGATGGVSLARPAASISLLDIIRAEQGHVSISVCAHDPAWCSRMGGCAVHKVWCEADRLVSRYLAEQDLASLAGAGAGVGEEGRVGESA